MLRRQRVWSLAADRCLSSCRGYERTAFAGIVSIVCVRQMKTTIHTLGFEVWVNFQIILPLLMFAHCCLLVIGYRDGLNTECDTSQVPWVAAHCNGAVKTAKQKKARELKRPIKTYIYIHIWSHMYIDNDLGNRSETDMFIRKIGLALAEV